MNWVGLGCQALHCIACRLVHLKPTACRRCGDLCVKVHPSLLKYVTAGRRSSSIPMPKKKIKPAIIADCFTFILRFQPSRMQAPRSYRPGDMRSWPRRPRISRSLLLPCATSITGTRNGKCQHFGKGHRSRREQVASPGCSGGYPWRRRWPCTYCWVLAVFIVLVGLVVEMCLNHGPQK